MALPTKGQDGSVRFGELFVFPRPTGGGTQMIVSVFWTLPAPSLPLHVWGKCGIIYITSSWPAKSFIGEITYGKPFYRA